jgi:hypothetical protein
MNRLFLGVGVIMMMIVKGYRSFGPALGAFMALIIWSMFFSSMLMLGGLVIVSALLGAFLHSHFAPPCHEYEAMIQLLDKHMTRESDGTFTLNLKDFDASDSPFADLTRSLAQTNQMIRDGQVDSKDVS